MVIPAEDINHLVDLSFSFANINKIIAKYTLELKEIFIRQGDLVLYPDNKVTAFKYKNNSYINTDYPDLIKHSTVINERPLHPTLVKKLNDIEEDYNQIGINKRRFEAYLKRAASYFAMNVYPSLTQEIKRENLTKAAFYFTYKVIPDGFNDSESTKNYFSSIFYTLTVDLLHLTTGEFKDVINNTVLAFQQKEDNTIQQFKQFIFKTTLLGF